MILAAGPVRAQDVDDPMPEPQNSRLPPGAVVQSLDDGPGAELRRNLTTLANNPRSLDALIGAGRAAIGLRDGQAASGFFTRAGQIAPDDPRVKAGQASAMLLSERPEQALILFAEAAQRGAPEAEIAADRGLAYDMIGDPRRAQQDYALALRRRSDPEVERRMALSLAISGQRDAALRVIDAQLRRHDRAAWRTQAFVLALTGDAAGADDTARRLMPAPNAQAMAPFFARLASLSPAQKAAAVNFGRFPSDGRASQIASNVDTRADPGALAMARGGPQARSEPPLAEPVNSAPRRRPGATAAGEERVGSLIRTPRRDVAPAVQPSRRVEVAQAQPQRFAPSNPDDENEPEDEAQQPDQQFQRPPVNRPREAPAFVPGGNFTLDTSREERRPPPPIQSATPGFGPIDPAPSVRQFESMTVQPSQPARQAPTTRFSDIATVVGSLTEEEAAAAAAAAARGPAPAGPLSPAERQARDAAAREAEARYRAQNAPAPAPARAGAGRYWVQIAHGAQRGALSGHYRDVHAQAPGLVESRTAWTVADRGTNRLLLGPFDDEAAAQDYIGQLTRMRIAAIPWQSAAGQSLDRLQGSGAASSSSSSRSARRAQPDRQPAPTTRAGRQAAARNTSTSDNRRSSSSRSGRAAAAADDRPTARNRSGRASASEERSNSRTRAGRSGSDDRNGARTTTSRGRAGAADRNTPATRSGTTRGSAASSRASSSSRSTQSRRASDDTPRTSRTRSSQERRPAANDTRTSRGRSSQEQGSAPSRRRSR